MKNQIPFGSANRLALIFLCLLIFSQCRKSDLEERIEPIVSLQFTGTFPDLDSGVFFSLPSSITHSGENFYVSDFRLGKIFVFNLQGEFIEELGQEGAGPQEFNGPRNLIYRDGLLYIHDGGNSRITKILTDTHEYSYNAISFALSTFTVADDKIYAISNYRTRENIDQIPFITYYDQGMNHIGSFGSYFTFVNNIIPTVSNSKMEIFENKLYVQSEYFPILRIFDLNGELLEVVTFELDDIYRDRVAVNYDPTTYADDNVFPVSALVTNFQVNEAGYFLNIRDLDNEGILIDHFDFDGTFIRRYTVNGSVENSRITDMIIYPDNNVLRFYFIQLIDDVPVIATYVFSENI